MPLFQKTELPEKSLAHWEVIALGVATFLASLCDFRPFGMRTFDLVAFGILLLLILFKIFENRSLRVELSYKYFVAIVIIYALYAFITVRHLSSIAITIGCVLLVGSKLLGRELAAVGPWYKWFTWTHIAAFSLQQFLFIKYHIILDYHKFYGQSSRIFNDSQQRGSGLFQEPNSYCLAIFMLVVASAKFKSSRFLTIVASITMIISQSLWGFAGVIVLTAMLEFDQKLNFWTATQKMLNNLAIIFTISLVFLYVTMPPSYVFPPIIERFAHIASDGSLRERYIENNLMTEGHVALERPPVPIIRIPTTVQFLFGSGLSTHYFLDHLPANGFALIGKSFGFFGSILLLWSLTKVFKPLSRRERWLVGSALVFSTTNYPLFTYLIFWVWLAYLLLPEKRTMSVIAET